MIYKTQQAIIEIFISQNRNETIHIIIDKDIFIVFAENTFIKYIDNSPINISIKYNNTIKKSEKFNFKLLNLFLKILYLIVYLLSVYCFLHFKVI